MDSLDVGSDVIVYTLHSVDSCEQTQHHQGMHSPGSLLSIPKRCIKTGDCRIHPMHPIQYDLKDRHKRPLVSNNCTKHNLGTEFYLILLLILLKSDYSNTN